MKFEKLLPLFCNFARIITAFLLGITVVTFVEYGVDATIFIANILTIAISVVCTVAEYQAYKDRMYDSMYR